LCLLLLLNLPPSEPPWFPDLLRKLLVADLAAQLPGTPPNNTPEITEDEARKLLGRASVLSLSEVPTQQAIAYEIATRLIELFDNRIPGLVSAADVILSRIGNFPGRRLLRRRCAGGDENTPEAPARLGLERIGREIENTVTGPDQREWALTDFQHEFFQALDSATSVSVSAPTSAGKSFILGLDLIRRLRKVVPACVVYVVPTRALIREVTLTIRKHLREAGMEAVPVRSVPFPIAQDKAPQGAVFVLTQERLLSLLHSREGTQWITTLVVDEAQSIRDEARGVILQTAIEAVLIKHPHAEVHFASPLASNPEFLLDVVQRRDTGRYLVRTLSPVSQNLILVSEVLRKKTQARFQLVGGDTPLDLGVRELGFELRGGTYTQRAALARAVTRDDESTLLFGNTPSDTEELAAALIAGLPPVAAPDTDIRELIEFIRSDLHPDYPLIQCLPHGVAYHYGFMPAIVRARVEDLCRDGKLKFVCCTSTLLQGVNLPARHIIIENPKRGREDGMTRADFLNLAGRAGRLLREFHGNVWCVRPATWEEKSYEGPQLTEIRSAMNEAMSDGGTIVQKVLRNEVSGKELDYGEATLGKVYCDFVRGQRDLAESSWKTEANAAALTATAQAVAALRVTLPTEVLDANRSVRPDRMQALYERLLREPDPAALVPLHPGAAGANDRMGTIILIVQETLGGVDNNSYLFYKWLAIQWIYNTPLSRIIASRLAYLRSQGSDQSLTASIRELLKTLEEAIRFRLVKYYMAYNSVLDLVLRERGDAATADALEPFHVYLECGASDRVALSLIALGLSRATALALRDKVQFPDEASPEDCLAKLATLDLATLAIPALCLREVKDLFGRD
jgi:DEAD/DEAH box helicase